MRPISASHIKLWNTCKRREAFVYRQGLREPSGVAAAAGTKVHALLEKPDTVAESAETWGKYDISRMARQLQAATPPGVVAREQQIDRELYGLPFTGRIDFSTETAVGDYKTAGKPRGVKTVAELEEDVQRLMYAELSGKPDALWIYGVWQDFSVTPVVVPGDAKRDREKFKLRVLQPAEELASVPEDVDPLSLEASITSCGLFPPAGCPFLTKCFDSHGHVASVLTTVDSAPAVSAAAAAGVTQQMSFLDAFKAPAAPTDIPSDNKQTVCNGSADGKMIGTLYIDSYPVAGVDQVQHAGELIAVAAQSVRSDAHVLHSQLVDFGKGAHMLAAQLAHDIKTAGEFYPHLYLETRSAEGKAVLFELSQLARVVVKGMV